MRHASQCSGTPGWAKQRFGRVLRIVVSPWSLVMTRGVGAQRFTVAVMENGFIT